MAQTVLSGNSFYWLEVDDVSKDTSSPVVQGEDCPKKVVAHAKRVQRQCAQCGVVFKGVGQYCHHCDDVAVTKYSNFVGQQGCELDDVDVMGFQAFVRRGKKGQFDFVGVLQLEVEKTMEEFCE